MSAEELAAMDAKIVADTIAEMQRQIEQLTGARHSMYDPAVAIARDIANRTPPAMSADHIGEAQGWRDIATAPRQEPVLVGHSGFLGWRRLAICNALGEWSYCDRPWLQQDPLDETPTHWMPLPPPPSAHPAPINPSGDTGELRERVARIIDPSAFLFSRDELDAKVRHHPHDAAYALADAILGLIQSERAGSPIGQNDQPDLAFSDAGELREQVTSA